MIELMRKAIMTRGILRRVTRLMKAGMVLSITKKTT